VAHTHKVNDLLPLVDDASLLFIQVNEQKEIYIYKYIYKYIYNFAFPATSVVPPPPHFVLVAAINPPPAGSCLDFLCRCIWWPPKGRLTTAARRHLVAKGRRKKKKENLPVLVVQVIGIAKQIQASIGGVPCCLSYAEQIISCIYLPGGRTTFYPCSNAAIYLPTCIFRSKWHNYLVGWATIEDQS
jgi:hypothetical protein